MNSRIKTKDMPRERLLRLGAASLSTSELIAILIGYGVSGMSAGEIASKLIADHDTLADIARKDITELSNIYGLGNAKACSIAAAFELAQRLQAEPFASIDVFSAPSAIANRMIPMLRNRRTESFYVLLMNSANKLIREIQVAQGTLNSVMIHPREVFRLAIIESAASIILVHNHPSGNLEPSKEDLAVTRQLINAGKIIDIKVLDHIIIAGDSYTSMAERRLM